MSFLKLLAPVCACVVLMAASSLAATSARQREAPPTDGLDRLQAPPQVDPVRAGLHLAGARGYSDAQAQCYAEVFARFATRVIVDGRGAWSASVTPAYSAELWRLCQISR